MLTRSSLVVLVISSLSLACAGNEPPPAESPAAANEPAAAAPAEETAADSTAPEDGWEGESEATEAPAAGGEPAAEGTPAADTKKEETRTIEVIAKILKDNRKPVRDCYEKALKDLPTLKGDMVIHLLLNPEGKIKKAELNVERSTLKSPAVSECAIAEIKKLSFPPSSRGMDTTVNYPYNLNP